MKQYFVPYDIAKELKEIGFDEFCFKYYDQSYDICSALQLIKWNTESKVLISAPLYDQVIDWLIEKHNINIVSLRYHEQDSWLWRVELMSNIGYGKSNTIKSYSNFSTSRVQGLQDAIKKAIKLIKQKK